MESVQFLKRRIRGVKNISQITKAMELVSATKMRKIESRALASRPYVFASLELLGILSELADFKSPYLENRETKRTLFLLVASDKGLAGFFNSRVIKEFEKHLEKNNLAVPDPSLVFAAVGEKAAAHLSRRGIAVVKKYSRTGDFVKSAETKSISDFITNGYLDKSWDKVVVFSTNFRSALLQKVLVKEIFPVSFSGLKETFSEIVPETGRFSQFLKENQISFFEKDASKNIKYIFEPSIENLVSELVPKLVEMQIYHIILETNASEHAARRLAMSNASSNAEEIVDDLSLTYNKLRQAMITKEIIEITAGKEALSS